MQLLLQLLTGTEFGNFKEYFIVGLFYFILEMLSLIMSNILILVHLGRVSLLHYVISYNLLQTSARQIAS